MKDNQPEPTLFQVDPEPPGLTCKTCKHRQRWQFNKKVIQYCGARRSNRTENGLLKIKAGDKACLLYEPEEIK
jgi:hypothetical protein